MGTATMSDAIATTTTTAPSRKTAIKRPVLHPVYREMIAAAVASLAERGGSSRQAIVKYIMSNYRVGTEATKVNNQVTKSLKAALEAGVLKHAKVTGTGATGSFRLGDQKKLAVAKPKKVMKPKIAVKKPVAAKKPKAATTTTAAAKTPKDAAAKKKPNAAAAKKPKSPKQAAASAKKLESTKVKPKNAKSPLKKAAKPKKANTAKQPAKK